MITHFLHCTYSYFDIIVNDLFPEASFGFVSGHGCLSYLQSDSNTFSCIVTPAERTVEMKNRRTRLCSCDASLAWRVSRVSGSAEYSERHAAASLLPASLYLALNTRHRSHCSVHCPSDGESGRRSNTTLRFDPRREGGAERMWSY